MQSAFDAGHRGEAGTAGLPGETGPPHPPGPFRDDGDIIFISDSDSSSGETGPPYPPGPFRDDGDIVFISDSDRSEMAGPAAASSARDSRSPFDRVLPAVFCGALIVVVLTSLAPRLTAEFQRLSAVSSAISLTYSVCLLLIAGSSLLLMVRSWRRYSRIRRMTWLRAAVARCREVKFISPDENERLRTEWNRYLRELEQHSDETTRKHIGVVRRRFSNYVGDSVRDADTIETCVLESLDRRADSVIDRRAVQVAVATAMASPMFDWLIVYWQSSRLIQEISRLYCGSPGMWGRLQLLRRGLTMVIFADVAALAAQVTTEVVAGKSLAVLGGRTVDGTANGLLVLRLGDAVRQQCRPVTDCRRGRHPLTRLAAALVNQGLSRQEAAGG